MPKKLQLSIPKPCHENWDAMTPVQQGKFCGSCQKQVVDFSNMSDRQVAQFFKKPSTGSVCGRFMTDQLERDIDIPKKRIPWFKYFFQFLLPAFLLSIKGSAQKTQGKIKVTTVTKDTTKPDKRPTMGIVAKPICIKPLIGDTVITPIVKGKINPVIANNNRVITGVVTDEKGDALPGVSVVIKGTRIGVLADNNGCFRILAKTSDVLVVTGAGLEPTEATVGTGNRISIAVRRIVLGGTEIIVGMISSSKLKKSKKKKEVPVLIPPVKDNTAKLFKVFPNPVPSGTNLNIEWKQTEEGYYSLQLIDQSGQSVYQQEIWIDADAKFLNMEIPVVPTGAYILSLINKKSGKKASEKIIIQ